MLDQSLNVAEPEAREAAELQPLQDAGFSEPPSLPLGYAEDRRGLIDAQKSVADIGKFDSPDGRRHRLDASRPCPL